MPFAARRRQLRQRTYLGYPGIITTCVWLLVLESCSGSAVNYTLDDTNFDQRVQGGATVEYSSVGVDGWMQGSTCTICSLKPDESLAFNHTWQDTTFTLGDIGSESMDITFVGSAIYAYFIVPDQVTNSTFTYTINLTVSLDGQVVDNFLHTPSNNGQDFIYNFLGYGNDNLELKQHELRFVPNNEPSSSVVLFDYVIYTTDTSLLSNADLSTVAIGSTSSSTTTQPIPSVSSDSISTTSPSQQQPSLSHKASVAGPVVGIVIGGVVFIGLVMAILYFRHKRKIAYKEDINEDTRSHPVYFNGSSSERSISYGVVTETYDERDGSTRASGISDWPLSTTGTESNTMSLITVLPVSRRGEKGRQLRENQVSPTRTYTEPPPYNDYQYAVE